MTYEWNIANKRARCLVDGAELRAEPKAGSHRWAWRMTPTTEAELERSGERASFTAAQEAAELAYSAWRNV